MTKTEINEAVADKLGWHRCTHGQAFGWSRPDRECFHVALPEFSTDIKAAWEVVDKFTAFVLNRRDDGKYILTFFTESRNLGTSGEQDTAPLAICMAFLELMQ